MMPRRSTPPRYSGRRLAGPPGPRPSLRTVNRPPPSPRRVLGRALRSRAAGRVPGIRGVLVAGRSRLDLVLAKDWSRRPIRPERNPHIRPSAAGKRYLRRDDVSVGGPAQGDLVVR